MDTKLKAEEQRIDLKVLHHLNRDDHRKKLKRFRRTVSAVSAIVSNKLYRSKASSLEAYFREAWKISRAQVYRFLDCAWVLKHLEGFPSQPCRERLCRSLKRLAKNRSDIRKLWESVLEKVDNDHEAVTSTIIATIWAELLEQGLVTGKPDPAGDEAAELLSDRDRNELDQDDSDSEMDGGNDGGAEKGLDAQGSDLTTGTSSNTLGNKESAPLTLEPALDRTPSDHTASLLGSTHSQTPKAYQNARTYQQPNSTFSDRTLPMPSTLNDVQTNNATGLSWRNTTLAPTSLDPAVPAPLTRGFSLPMLRDLPRAAPARPTWSNVPTPTTQSHDPLNPASIPTSNHMVIPHTRPLWTTATVASANANSNGTAAAPSITPAVPMQHAEIPTSDVNTCADLLDSFSRKGYALQPYVHGRWIEEPASQWRIAPIDPRFRRIPLLYVPNMSAAPPSNAVGNLLMRNDISNLGGKESVPSAQHQTTRSPTDPQIPPPPTQYVYITASPNSVTPFITQQSPPLYGATPPPQYSPQYEYERFLALQGRYAGAQTGMSGVSSGGNTGVYTVRSLPSQTSGQGLEREHAAPVLPLMQTSPVMSATSTHQMPSWMGSTNPVAAAAGAAGTGTGDHGHRSYAGLPMHVAPQAQQQGQEHDAGAAGYGAELGNGASAGTAW
ncbi:hypothetical protein HDV00_003024 [Rhizophlyctis rosea]|nr:hypothetical protein HDV00_003024 [Rhizophlyctis rosea]